MIVSTIQPMNVIKSSGEFQDYLQYERKLSTNTVSAYLHDLGMFDRFCTEEGISNIDTAAVRQFNQHLQTERGVGARALARKISCLRTYFSFACARELYSKNPMQTICNPKMATTLPYHLNENMLQQLLTTPDQSTELGYRDFVVLLVFSYSGVRLSELTSMDVGSIDFEDRTMRVHGKGDKERIVPMIDLILQPLQVYLERRGVFNDPQAPLVTSKRGTRISPRAIEHMVEKYRKVLSIPQGQFSPHKLRHTFATMLHTRNKNIVEIKELLGHASISTTQIYTHSNPVLLRQTVESLVPTSTTTLPAISTPTSTSRLPKTIRRRRAMPTDSKIPRGSRR